MTLCRILEIGIGLQKGSARNRKLAEVGFIDRDQEHHIIQESCDKYVKNVLSQGVFDSTKADEVLIGTNIKRGGEWLKNSCKK